MRVRRGKQVEADVRGEDILGKGRYQKRRQAIVKDSDGYTSLLVT